MRKTIIALHSAIIKNDWPTVRSLFDPNYERYVGGRYIPEVFEGQNTLQALQFLFEHGKFVKFAFSEPVGTRGSGFARFSWSYIPNGTNVVFSNTHLIEVKINSKGKNIDDNDQFVF